MMKKHWPIIALLSLTLISTFNLVKGDEDEEEEHENRESRSLPNGEVRKITTVRDFQTPINPKWKTECSSCHMLYLPGLLPERSWNKVMGGLKNHFGENAELDAKTQKEITDFLIQNSADKVHSRRGDRILNGIKNSDAPIRISDTQYFKQKHDELSPSVFKRSSIKFAGNCLACHSGAEKGDFSEDNVRIPKDNVVKKVIKP